MKEDVLGYAVDTQPAAACVESVFDSLMGARDEAACCRWLACLNPHSYTVALGDAVFARALDDADWLVPDGVGVVLASRILGGRISGRVTGSDIFLGLHQRMNAHGSMSVFFLGGTGEALAQIREKLARDFPNIRIAGTYSPPFKASYSPEEVTAMVELVNAGAADVLWVGMTAPKQEKWIFENRSRLDVKFAGAIGAVFDFYTGQVRRSSPLMQRLGLEWLPRLVQQPGRLWRRTFVSAPVFLWHVVRQKMRCRS